MSIFTVDVGFSADVIDPETERLIRGPGWAQGEDWHRVTVEAADGDSAELLACQIVASHGSQTVVWSCVWV